MAVVGNNLNPPVRTFFGPRVTLPTGLVLGSEDRAGIEWRVEGLEGWDQVETTGSHTQRSYQHGAWVDRAWYVPRIFTVTGRVHAPAGLGRGECYEALVEAGDRLLASLPADDLGEVVVVTGARERIVRARMDGPQFYDVQDTADLAEFSIQLVAPDPRRLSGGAAHVRSTGLPTTTGGLIIPGRWE